jgi:hypothetical protein
MVADHKSADWTLDPQIERDTASAGELWIPALALRARPE